MYIPALAPVLRFGVITRPQTDRQSRTSALVSDSVFAEEDSANLEPTEIANSVYLDSKCMTGKSKSTNQLASLVRVLSGGLQRAGCPGSPSTLSQTVLMIFIV